MKGLLVLKVVLVAYNHCLDFVMGIVFDLEEPFVEILKAIAFCEVEDKESSD